MIPVDLTPHITLLSGELSRLFQSSCDRTVLYHYQLLAQLQLLLLTKLIKILLDVGLSLGWAPHWPSVLLYQSRSHPLVEIRIQEPSRHQAVLQLESLLVGDFLSGSARPQLVKCNLETGG